MPLAPKGSKANMKTPPTKATPKTFKPSSRPYAKADAKTLVKQLTIQAGSPQGSAEQNAARNKVQAAGKRLIASGGVPKAATKKARAAGDKAFKAKSK